jgi:hypothetical protein
VSDSPRRADGMPLAREQHAKLAETYSNPDPDWSPDEVARAKEWAKVLHEVLSKPPGKAPHQD